MRTLREHMEQEQRDPTEPEEFYYPCASDTPMERRQRLAAVRKATSGDGDFTAEVAVE